MNAATIELLLSKGLSGEDILDVARAMEVKADRTNAERQARHRAKKRNAVTVTGDTPPKERKSNPPEPICSNEQTNPNELPTWLPAKPWREFVEMRRSMGKRAPFTDAAQRNIIAKLGKLRGEGHDPADLLTEAVSRGWRGVFAPEVRPKPGRDPPSYLDHLIENRV
jgi:hypothetical protein